MFGMKETRSRDVYLSAWKSQQTCTLNYFIKQY